MKQRKLHARRLLAMLMAALLLTASAGVAEKLPDDVRYQFGYNSFEELEVAADETNAQLVDEGAVLLKNDGVLPFDEVKNITVLGPAAHEVEVLDTNKPNGQFAVLNDFAAVMASAGYSVNPSEEAFDGYTDAAIVVLKRIASEGRDIQMRDVEGHADRTEHRQMLTDAERETIAAVKAAGFSKIVVVLNTNNAMEIKELEDDPAVNAILMIGYTGATGLREIPRILSGDVNPSGRLVDVWAADFTKDPTYQNFGDNSQTNLVDGVYTPNTAILNAAGETVTGFSIEYEEGIYVGYRWYETAAAEGILKDPRIGYNAEDDTYTGEDEYYNRSTGVLYPFGYGLSYTTFEQKINVEASTPAGALSEDGTITIAVDVTNTGDVAGKDVVQLYYTAPYTKGGIEKAAVNLVAFGKTELLEPGDTETVTLTFAVRDMASYDYSDANANGFKGWEVEEGSYIISVRNNSHEVFDSLEYTVAESCTYATDDKTGNAVENRFSNGDRFDTTRTGVTVSGEGIHFTSRADLAGTFHTAPTAEDLTFTDEAIELLVGNQTYYAYQDQESDPWYVAEVPADWKQEKSTDLGVEWERSRQYFTRIYRENGEKADIQLIDMVGLSADDPKWTEFMNQMTWEEMVYLVSEGWRETIQVDSIGKPVAYDEDGPGQIGMAMGAGLSHPDDAEDIGYPWSSSMIISQTWNAPLAYASGAIIGQESMILNMNGWYAPGADSHRSPFSGRNYEYFSSDGVQGGLMAGAQCKGATDYGCNVYLKHYGLNDQETNRTGGLATWASEQAIREIYMKQFELAIKTSDLTGTMSAYNLMGLQSSQNYALYNELTIGEWGFRGYAITDRNTNKMYVDYEEGIYSGYRYYETRGATDGDAWYSEHVVFPFGYGLSYTSFSQEIVKVSGSLSADAAVTVEVKVTNTGKVAGKEVVELYANLPYSNGGIEKAHTVLADFAKTKKLEPGESQTLTLETTAYALASFDYQDANSNGFKGYELEAGDYRLYLGADVHTVLDSSTLQLAADIRWETDPVTGETVSLLYEDADDELGSRLSRMDWEGTWPAARTEAERAASESLLAALGSVEHNNPNADSYTERPTQGAEGTMVLKDMMGAAYDDPRWETLLDQVTINEMISLFNDGAFHTNALESIDKPLILETDGPVGFVNFMDTSNFFGTCSYPAQVVIASTWNTEMAEAMGVSVGNEGILGNNENGGMPYSGWYAPGMNIHRSAFCGRNYEYCSEDPVLTGKIATGIAKGATSKGVYTYAKHFALNEQETDRSATGGLVTWVDEQTMREVYLRQFEMLVKSGYTTGMMSSFNRIGTTWAGGDWRLLTQILRNEWGFHGSVISDFTSGSYMNGRQMAYAGGSLNLNNQTKYNWSLTKKNITTPDIVVLRNNTKDILYTSVNSNAYTVEILGYTTPTWIYLLIGIDAFFILALAIWGFFALRKGKQKKAA